MSILLKEKIQIPESELLYSKKDLKLLLVPLIIENVLSSLMGMADTLMVSNVGEAALSGVSLVDTINVLILFVFSALAAGGTIICSQYLGSKQYDNAKKSAEQVMLVSFVLSLIPLIGCGFFHNGILKFIYKTLEADVLAAANIYFLLTALSYPFVAMQTACASLFRAEGDSKTPMNVTIVANIINVIGNAVLIFVFKMGVTGAASATLFARIVSAVWLMILLTRPGHQLQIANYLKLKPDFSLIGRILNVGVPTGIEQGLFQLGKLLVASTVASLGTAAISAQALIQIFEGMHCFPSIAVGTGLVTIAGTCMGAGRVDQVKYYARKLCILSEMLVISVVLIILAFIPVVTRVANLSPESAKLFRDMMIFISIFKPFLWVLAFTLPNAMRAAGDVKFGAIVSAISMWVFRVGLTILLCRVWGVGLIGVWIGWMTDWAVRLVIYVWRFRSGKWATKRVI